MNNIYYDPEKFGLTTVGSVEWRPCSYEFDFTVVWKQGGKYLTGSDSGCSCPTPFEDHGINDLDGPFTKTQLRKHLMDIVEARADDSYGYSKDNLTGQVLDIMSRI